MLRMLNRKMSSGFDLMRWMLLWLLLVGVCTATPAPAPFCGGNSCYPVLVGPLKSIAKDYCSYYLKLPRTTTVTAKITTTVTNGYTLPAQAFLVTATTKTTVTASVTITTTAAGPTVTKTATQTVTVNNAVKKRDPAPLFTPPKGAGDGYTPPLLAVFAPAVISAACSCVVPPTTKTITTTSTAAAIVTRTSIPPAVTKTVSTVTITISVTQIATSVVTADPVTTTVTTTATATLAPAPTCDDNPGTAQRGVIGFLKPVAEEYPPRRRTPSGLRTAEECYNDCKAFEPPLRTSFDHIRIIRLQVFAHTTVPKFVLISPMTLTATRRPVISLCLAGFSIM